MSNIEPKNADGVDEILKVGSALKEQGYSLKTMVIKKI